MKLLVVELHSSLEQVVRSSSIQQVEAIRIHLYKHNAAAGSLQVRIKDGPSVIGVSEIINIADISDSPFFHGQVTFRISNQLNKNKDYVIELVSSDGYSFSESAYVGWCLDFEFHSYSKGYDDIGSNLKSAFDYEIWSRK